MKSLKLVAAAVALASVGSIAPASAADAMSYPSRPIRLIVPNGPGSAVDTLTRIVSNNLNDVIGQQIVVDNRGGAAGIIGMEIAKNANADGYTLITATTAATTIARLLVKKPPFHPLNDYDSVVQFAETLNVLVVNRSLPVNNMKDFLSYAKSGKTFNMASAGVGSQSHLSGAYLQQEAGLNLLHVPYKGGGASSAAVASGESQWSLVPAPAAMRHVAAGRMRAIAHSLPRATPLLPNIPPIADTIPGFDYTGWMGFFAPKGTPKPVIDKLRVAVVRTMEKPAVKKGMTFQATEIIIRDGPAFTKVVRESMGKNAALVKSLKLSAN